MQIEIKPSDIDQYVKEALINSSIGESVKTVVKNLIENKYDNPIQRELESIIYRMAAQMIDEKFKDVLTAAIQERINTFFTPERIAQCADGYISHLERVLERNSY